MAKGDILRLKVLEYKEQFLEFVEAKKSFQVFETRQVLFLVLDAQSRFSSKISFGHPPTKVWKKLQPFWQHVKKDHNRRNAKKKGSK
jgi:hypothetical protein